MDIKDIKTVIGYLHLPPGFKTKIKTAEDMNEIIDMANTYLNVQEYNYLRINLKKQNVIIEPYKGNSSLLLKTENKNKKASKVSVIKPENLLKQEKKEKTKRKTSENKAENSVKNEKKELKKNKNGLKVKGLNTGIF